MQRSWLGATIAAALAAEATVAAQRWAPQQSGVSARLRGLSAVSERVAWASGAEGTVVRTVDGGATWRSLAVPGAGALDFRDIEAFDENVAYLLSIGPGPASRIFKTKDGGASWQTQFANDDPKAFFDAIAFWDARHGVAASDSVDGRFVILLTDDGGASWTRVPEKALPPALPGEGAFAASGTSLAVHGSSHVWLGTGAASAARVLRSSDRGRSWAVATTPLAAGPSAGIFSVAFRDARAGIVVGGDYKKEAEAADNAAVTGDGGATWTLVRGLTGFRSAVAYLPGSKPPLLIAVGPKGADLSRDDARSWSVLEAPGFHAFQFARQGEAAWGAGEDGRIARLHEIPR